MGTDMASTWAETCTRTDANQSDTVVQPPRDISFLFKKTKENRQKKPTQNLQVWYVKLHKYFSAVLAVHYLFCSDWLVCSVTKASQIADAEVIDSQHVTLLLKASLAFFLFFLRTLEEVYKIRDASGHDEG